MAVRIVLIILGFVCLFLLFSFQVLLGVIAIALGVLDLFFVGRAWGPGPRRYWY
jgi:hypothetical protein